MYGPGPSVMKRRMLRGPRRAWRLSAIVSKSFHRSTAWGRAAERRIAKPRRPRVWGSFSCQPGAAVQRRSRTKDTSARQRRCLDQPTLLRPTLTAWRSQRRRELETDVVPR